MSEHGGCRRFSMASGDGDSERSVKKFGRGLRIRKNRNAGFVRGGDFRMIRVVSVGSDYRVGGDNAVPAELADFYAEPFKNLVGHEFFLEFYKPRAGEKKIFTTIMSTQLNNFAKQNYLTG